MTVATAEPSGTAAAIPAETAAMSLPQKIEYAKVLAESGMIPKHYQKQPANVLVAMEYGQALGIAPIVAINQITVVNGGASMEAKLMISLARKAGHRVRLEGDETHAVCTIIRADDPTHESVVRWDEAKAKKAGLWGGGHWAKNPGLMLRYRAASECIRLTCPEVLAGITYTPEEVEEIAHRNARPTITLTQVPPAKTAAEYMKTLKLNGRTFKEFAARVLGGDVTSWEGLAEAERARILGALAQWEQSGVDPTLAPTSVDVETGEIIDGEVES